MPRSADASRITPPQILRGSLFLGSALLVAALFLFTHEMVRRLSAEVATTSGVLARFCARGSIPATRDPELQKLFLELTDSIDFPIVITDLTGAPRAWNKIVMDPRLVSDAAIDSFVAGVKIPPDELRRIQQVRAVAAALDRQVKPIPVEQPGTGIRLGLLHYGSSPLLNGLRWMPLLAVGGTLLLLSIGLWGLAGLQQAERRSIWVGMAKETAHQLGTPLSSLMGWIELLRSRAEGPDEAPRIPRAELDETLGEMERDVERLSKVAQRFSHVGSTPRLQLKDVTPVVQGAVHYVRRRLPHGEGEVVIRERYGEIPPINLNPELLEWAVENLLTNAVSALDKKPGLIEVAVERRAETEEVEVSVTDNGRGMTAAELRRAFEPGFSTKRRGWGLGLALTRRVVQDYHGGRLYIRHSAPGQGTTVVISFPT